MFTMTTRNLNQTWRDVVFNPYAADHAADVQFPVRYLINASQWKRDIFIEIPTKIDVVCTLETFFNIFFGPLFLFSDSEAHMRRPQLLPGSCKTV